MRIETTFIQNYLTRPHFKGGASAVLIVLGLCLLASWNYWNPTLEVSKYLAASYKSVFHEGQVWRLFTTSFVHADLEHLLSNSFMLSLLLYFVTSFYGMTISIAVSFIAAIMTNAIVLFSYGEPSTLVGASGVVYYLWGFWMVLYFFIQRHYSKIERVLRLGTVFLILLVPTQFQPSTSYLAHYLGFGIGLAVGAVYYFLKRKSLHDHEVWSYRQVNDELTDLDIIALSYPREDS